MSPDVNFSIIWKTFTVLSVMDLTVSMPLSGLASVHVSRCEFLHHLKKTATVLRDMDLTVSMPLSGLASVCPDVNFSIIWKTTTLLPFMDPFVSMPFDLMVSLAAAAQMLSTLRGWLDGWFD
jgi:hypothetical protein